MTHTEAKLLSEVLANRVDLASHSYAECYVVDESEACNTFESILMEYVKGDDDD
jgi:hypothetical protein